VFTLHCAKVIIITFALCNTHACCRSACSSPAPQNKKIKNRKYRNKNFACLRKKNIFFNLFTDIRIRNRKKYLLIFFSYEFLPTPELELFVVEFLPTPELELFGVGIFTNGRVGIIRDRIFIGVRVRNIINKSS